MATRFYYVVVPGLEPIGPFAVSRNCAFDSKAAVLDWARREHGPTAKVISETQYNIDFVLPQIRRNRAHLGLS